MRSRPASWAVGACWLALGSCLPLGPALGNAPKALCDAVSPVLDVAQASQLGDIHRRYETDFKRYAEKHWATDGAGWAAANFYDRTAIFYVWYCRTGDAIYRDRAAAIARSYIEEYLAPNKFSPVAHWSQMRGVFYHYLQTRDERVRDVIGHVADYFSNPFYTRNLHKTRDAQMDNRIQAKTIEAFLVAYLSEAPTKTASGEGRPKEHWSRLLKASLDQILSTQSADGAYRFEGFGYHVKPFMVGMLNSALIDYHDFFERDPRIPAAVRKSLDYMWERDWVPEAQAFRYLEKPFNGEPSDPAADLNLLMSQGFGWFYRLSGDARYRERGDQVFAGGVRRAWLAGSKQFNQQYTTSWSYSAYLLLRPQ